MLFIVYCVLLSFLCSCLAFFLKDVVKPQSYPPGPPWLPIVGCYLEIKSLLVSCKYYYLVWEQLGQIYGKIVGLRLGRDNIVLAMGYEAVKYVLCEEGFEGRPDGFFFRLRSLGDRLGVVFVEGRFMQEQRSFSLQQLRNFGNGRETMLEIITVEAEELAKMINSKCQYGPLQVHRLFDVSVLNTLWTMVAGHRFQLDDERLLKMVGLVHDCFRLVDTSGGLLNQMPFLRHIFPSMTGYYSLVANVDEMMKFFREVISKHKKHSGCEDFVCAFLRRTHNDDNKETSFTENQLLVLLEDLFMAGTETMSSTLSFAILYLVKYPAIQEKIHIEMNKNMARDEMPTIRHRKKLVWLEAFIMEMQRHANPVPITIPHRALENTTLMGYNIPKHLLDLNHGISVLKNIYLKGTFILPSLYSVHMDADYWIDPTIFRPERFINDKGEIVNDPHFIPFAIGKRRCIGEILAKATLFLFLSTLLKNFRIEGICDESADILDGFTLAPAAFSVKFMRKEE